MNTHLPMQTRLSTSPRNNTDMTGHQNNGKSRAAISPGCTVDVIRKEDQRTGKLSRGVVAEILTKSLTHPHGIKVRLKDGTVGRVAGIVRTDPSGDS